MKGPIEMQKKKQKNPKHGGLDFSGFLSVSCVSFEKDARQMALVNISKCKRGEERRNRKKV